MVATNVTIRDGIDTLKDRFVPRFEVFFAKPDPSPPPPAPVQAPLDPDAATADEKKRLDSLLFVVSPTPGGPPPKLTQLLPLAGPWGEKRDQRTDDIVSVRFTDSVGQQQSLAQVEIEIVNVYDFHRKFYRYTDVPQNLSPGRTGAFPLIEYGDTIALRFGYGSNIDWVFEGIVSKVSVDFPADGDSRLQVCAVDKRDRLRSKKQISTGDFGGSTEEELIAHVARTAGLRVAARSDQLTKLSSAARRLRSTDQDAMTFITDRANKAARELLCFGNTLYVLPKGDITTEEALRYEYRRGLISFKPDFNGVGKPTRVRVVSHNPKTHQKVFAEVGSEDLVDLDLARASEGGTPLETVERSGQAGPRIEVVTNYLAVDASEAKRIAIGILKRNLDATFTATGDLIGDPRVRARSLLAIEGVGRFGGLWYVETATHQFGAGGYQTHFEARRPESPSNRASNGQSAGGVA
jgi:uncharacterized protein